jgi:tRNA (guanine6-N2)-methyltransferase
MDRKRIFALTTRSLEAISTAEIASHPGVKITETAYRRVAAEYDGSLAPLLNLRTVDDLYLDLATWTNVGHTRDTLAAIQEWSAELDLIPAVQACIKVRPISQSPLFSVTTSFVGKRNYSTDEIKTAVATGITANNGWTYTLDDRQADLNIRVFIEHEIAYVGVRLSKSPLHERSYKQIQRPGSLKPPVAAAMLHLAKVLPAMKLLDPCCGAGTILIEGAQMGAVCIGGDLAKEAVEAAWTNANLAEITIDIRQWDAQALPLLDQSVDRVVTNLPWGRQINVDAELGGFYRRVCTEIERVLKPGGRVAILTSTPHLLRFDQLKPDLAIEISLFGQTPTIALYSATR